MKAIILKGFGGIENLEMADVPVPEIKDDEVLIRVKAAAVNPIDIKTRKGQGLAGMLKEYDPVIPGWDISGEITASGKLVSSFKKGDEAFGMINFPGHGRAYAEYVAAPASHLALKPSNISHEEAAGASLAALTAWQIVKEKAALRPGDRVLIHGASGGVGHFAVQMAGTLGAHVIGTSSGRNRDFILSLGAEGHVDYEIQKFEDILKDIDFVLDTVGGDYIDRSLEVLKPGGLIISINSGASENVAEKAEAKGMKGLRFMVRSNGDNMKEIADLLQKGSVKTYVSELFALSDAGIAHTRIETSRTTGKICLIP